MKLTPGVYISNTETSGKNPDYVADVLFSLSERPAK